MPGHQGIASRSGNFAVEVASPGKHTSRAHFDVVAANAHGFSARTYYERSDCEYRGR
jgi:hypothetical protein